jgi:hypothetical protein
MLLVPAPGHPIDMDGNSWWRLPMRGEHDTIIAVPITLEAAKNIYPSGQPETNVHTHRAELEQIAADKAARNELENGAPVIRASDLP